MLRCARKFRRNDPAHRGFTLLELILVILLFVVMSGLVVSRFDSLLGWKRRGDIRKFVDTWEFLYTQALSRNEGYQLRINLDSNSYQVFRELAQKRDSATQVDYLQNLRTKGEQERRAAAVVEDLPTIDEEYAEDDLRQSQDLETLFYSEVFADPGSSVRLGRPLEFPKLAKPQELTTGVRIRDVRTPRGKKESGVAYIRFSPRGAGEFAVVHFLVDEVVYTALMNPATGRVRIESGDKDFEWLLDTQA